MSVDTIFVNICYLKYKLQTKLINILYICIEAHLLSECRHWGGKTAFELWDPVEIIQKKFDYILALPGIFDIFDIFDMSR